MSERLRDGLAKGVRRFGLPLLFLLAAIPAAVFSNQLLSAARSAAIVSLESRLDGLVAVLRYGDLPFLRLEIDRLSETLPVEGRIAALSDAGVTFGSLGSERDRTRLEAISGDGPSVVELSTGPVLARRLNLAQTPASGLQEIQDLTLYVANPWPGPAERATRQAVLIGWLGFLVAVSIAVGLQFWHARDYRRRLDRLNRRLAAIGQGDLAGLEPDSTAPSELVELRRQINVMLGDLRDLVFGLNAFVETVAHELRTPLTRMRLSADRLLAQDTTDGSREVEGLKGDILDLSRLFESLVDLAKARAGRFDRSAFRSINLSRLLLEIHEDLEEDMALAGSPLVLALAEDIEVLGDAALMRRLIENLLDNARKFSIGPEPVGLTLSSGATRFRLSVENHGPAFPDGLVEHPAARPAIGNVGQGLGLGLGIVRAIALKHGWTIRFTHVDGVARVELEGDRTNLPNSTTGETLL